MTTVLLRLQHGSHLYGTAHRGSDIDLYEVVDTVRPGQYGTSRYGLSEQAMRRSGGRDLDLVRKDLGTWLREAQAGVPQACEAAWAPDDAVEVDLIRDLRLGLRVGSSGWARHRRAMRNFASGYWDGGGQADPVEYAMKRARHALRLAHNLAELRRRGRYSPRVEPEAWAGYRRAAENLRWGDELWETCDAIAMGGWG